MLQGSRQMNQSVKYRQNAAVCYEAVRILTVHFDIGAMQY
jgi:hypothetical protein